MIYGYARCSTNEGRQDIDRQKRELYALGVIDDKYIYWEYESGVKTDRVELQKLLNIVKIDLQLVTLSVVPRRLGSSPTIKKAQNDLVILSLHQYRIYTDALLAKFITNTG